MEEVDILRGGDAHDLLSSGLQDKILASIKAGEWEIVMAAPPCSTSSWATFSNDGEPKPLRDRQWPEGFPWLPQADRKRVDIDAQL